MIAITVQHSWNATEENIIAYASTRKYADEQGRTQIAE
jgi:hypothetical protein